MRARLVKLWVAVVMLMAMPNLLLSGEAQNAFNEAVKFHRAGKFKEAIAAYDRALKAAPNAAEAYLGRGWPMPGWARRIVLSRITTRQSG